MGIGYFPDIYPDELIYSVLSRYYMHSGYTYYKEAEEELFKCKQSRVDIEYVKQLKPKVVELLTSGKGIEDILKNHTMYPFYGKFINRDRKNKAFLALMDMNGDYSKLLGVPQLRKGETRFLRYCPLCAIKDMKLYSENYFHRLHQMRGCCICPIHGCYLVDSEVSLDSRNSVHLVAAEMIVPNETKMLEEKIILCTNQTEIKLADYMAKVFQTPINEESETNIGRFLHCKMVGTSYLSSRGEHNYHNKLWKDMKVYYQGVHGIDELLDAYIQRLLIGKRVVFHEICMTAMFLNIGYKELSLMEVPLKSPEEEFDEKVKALMKTGIGMKQTARELGVAFSMVKMVVDISQNGKSYEKKNNKNRMGSKKEVVGINWDVMDKEYLPKVKKAISDLHGNGKVRPRKISIYSVGKELNIHVQRLRNMTMCKMEIEKNIETLEQHRARKVEWAVNTLKKEKLPILYWRITAISKLERDEIDAVIPFIDREIATIIKQI